MLRNRTQCRLRGLCRRMRGYGAAPASPGITYTFTDGATWIAPRSGSARVIARGSGGSGAQSGGDAGGGGGGGGGVAISIVTLIQGASYTVQMDRGTPTAFLDDATSGSLVYVAGSFGEDGTEALNGGAGGLPGIGGSGDITYDGAPGDDGGGVAGANGGGAASDSADGIASAGGAGGAADAPGSPGLNPGDGGGGAGTTLGTQSGGLGAIGEVIITYL